MSHLSRPPRGQQRDKPYREALAAEEPVLIEWSGVRDANGSGGHNEDTAPRTKR